MSNPKARSFKYKAITLLLSMSMSASLFVFLISVTDKFTSASAAFSSVIPVLLGLSGTGAFFALILMIVRNHETPNGSQSEEEESVDENVTMIYEYEEDEVLVRRSALEIFMRGGRKYIIVEGGTVEEETVESIIQWYENNLTRYRSVCVKEGSLVIDREQIELMVFKKDVKTH